MATFRIQGWRSSSQSEGSSRDHSDTRTEALGDVRLFHCLVGVKADTEGIFFFFLGRGGGLALKLGGICETTSLRWSAAAVEAAERKAVKPSAQLALQPGEPPGKRAAFAKDI